MDSSRQEETKSSSDEEIGEPGSSSDDNGIGRSYECAFCKRGFTTAQALGGHMNIHRKDRAAKPKPPSNRSLDDYYATPGIYLSTIPSYVKNYNPVAHEAQIVNDPNINSLSSPQGARSIISRDLANGSRVQFPQSFDGYIKEKHYGGLSLRLGPASAEETQAKRQRCNREDEEVDLELRLGHYP